MPGRPRRSLDQGSDIGPAPDFVGFLDVGQGLGGKSGRFPEPRTGKPAYPNRELRPPSRDRTMRRKGEPPECIAAPACLWRGALCDAIMAILALLTGCGARAATLAPAATHSPLQAGEGRGYVRPEAGRRKAVGASRGFASTSAAARSGRGRAGFRPGSSSGISSTARSMPASAYSFSVALSGGARNTEVEIVFGSRPFSSAIRLQAGQLFANFQAAPGRGIQPSQYSTTRRSV